MWDLKLFLISFFFLLNTGLEVLCFRLLDLFDPFVLEGLNLTNLKVVYRFTYNSSIFFTIKFLAVTCFLILVRGGTPRYRYDYLTKLGWLKFIGLVITVFFFSIISFFSF